MTSLCLVAGPQSSISSRSPSLSTGSCRSGWAWAFQRTECIFRPFSVFTITEVVCLLRGWSQAYHPVGGGNQALGSSAGQSRLDFSSSAGWGGGASIAGLQGLFFMNPLISAHFRHYYVIPAIPGWPLVQSRPTGMSVGFCLPSVIDIEHMLYNGRRSGKGQMTAK